MSAAREPTREQAEAIGVRGRDVLLEAGAGTGKTGVLVDRYCDLVASDGVSPDAILAFTFTDKAAAQLRERARDELRRRETDEPQAAEDLDALVAGFGGALITTIHGFCRRLLAAHPMAAGIDPRFRVLDQSEASRAAGAAFDAALEDFLADGDPEREATVAAYYVDGLRAMVAAAYEELRSRGLQTPQLPDPPAADLASAMDKLEAAATEALGAPGGSGAQRGKMEQALELCVEQGQLPSLDELAVLDFGKPKGARGECAKALRAAIAAAAASGEGGVVYEHLRELLGLFGKRFAEQKAARAGLDDKEGIGLLERVPPTIERLTDQGTEDRTDLRARDEVGGLTRNAATGAAAGREESVRSVERGLDEDVERHRSFAPDQPAKELGRNRHRVRTGLRRRSG